MKPFARLCLVTSMAFALCAPFSAPPVRAQQVAGGEAPDSPLGAPGLPAPEGEQIPEPLASALQQSKLVASDADALDNFGISVALSADGNTALVGAAFADNLSANAGSAYVFVRSGSAWTQQQQLEASDAAPNDNFGLAVSLSADGNTALVGAQNDDTNGIDAGSAYVFVLPPLAGELIISEFRLQGPNGANDEYVEIYNASKLAHTVMTTDGSTGYAVAASDGVPRCTIPSATVIPGQGHYLCVNSIGYSQADYPAGNGTTATGDATYTLDIPLNAGIALFNTSNILNFTADNRLDAVGSVSEANALYKEGTGYPNIANINLDYALPRDLSTGLPKDTNNNEADFWLVEPNGASMCTSTVNFRCERLGAAGPENLSGPVQRSPEIFGTPLDPCVSPNVAPNRVRTPCPCNVALPGCQCAAQNATFGTLSIRRSFHNNTGAPVTRLRFRVTDMTTFPVLTGTADLRLITSANAVTPDAPFSVTVDRAPCGTGTMSVTVEPTTLETGGLGQPNGGGYNSTVSAGTVTLANPLPAGGEINLQFLLGVQQSGSFRFFVTVEALP